MPEKQKQFITFYLPSNFDSDRRFKQKKITINFNCTSPSLKTKSVHVHCLSKRTREQNLRNYLIIFWTGSRSSQRPPPVHIPKFYFSIKIPY